MTRRLDPTRLLTGGAALAAAVVAVVAGVSMAAGDRRGMVLPLAAVAGIAVAVLALTRFAGYVLLMLAVRSCVDLFKLTGPSAGQADSAGTARAVDPSTLLAVLFLLAAGLWLAAQLSRHGRLRGSPLSWAMLLVGASSVVSALGASRPANSLLEALRILTVVVMFVVLEQLMPDTAAIRRVLLACYASLVLALGYTVVLSLLGNPPAEVKGDFTRISGTFSQSTTFGRYLMFMVIFGFAVYRFLDPSPAGVPRGAARALAAVPAAHQHPQRPARRGDRPGGGRGAAPQQADAGHPLRGGGRRGGPGARRRRTLRPTRYVARGRRRPDRKHPGLADRLLDRDRDARRPEPGDRHRAEHDPARDRRGEEAAQRLPAGVRGDRAARSRGVPADDVAPFCTPPGPRCGARLRAASSGASPSGSPAAPPRSWRSAPPPTSFPTWSPSGTSSRSPRRPARSPANRLRT